jgi:hypothetical protein
MTMLTIAAQAVPVTRGAAKDTVEQGGDSMRANAGALSSDIRWEKRRWTFTSDLMTQAEVTALRALVALAAQVSCAGDLIGAAPATCEVTITEASYVTLQSAGVAVVYRTLGLTLVEV